MEENSHSGSEDVPWYQNPVFSRFWRNYNRTMNWCQYQMSTGMNKHTVYENWCTSLADYHTRYAIHMRHCYEYYSHMANLQRAQAMSGGQHGDCFLQPHSPPVKNARRKDTSSKVHPHGKRRRSRTRKRQRSKKSNSPKDNQKKRKTNNKLFSDLEDIPSDLEFVLDLSGDLECGLKSDKEEVEYHMEITEDMLEFFAQSAKHKREREAAMKKEEKDDASDEDYMDLAYVSAHRNKASTTAAPSEQPGARRVTEMSALYGDKAPMIHAMETALQLTYNRYCDRKQPKLWPQLPLNIKFE